MEKMVYVVSRISKRCYDPICYSFDEEKARYSVVYDNRHLTAAEREGVEYILDVYKLDVLWGETAEEAFRRMDEEAEERIEPIRNELVKLPVSMDFDWDAHKMYEAYNWDSIVELMDDEIRESLNRQLAPCDDEKFLSAYLAAHVEKYGENFVVC